MGLILLAVAGAALVARACGGRPARLKDGPVRGWRLLAVALLVELLAQAVAVAGTSGWTGPVNGAALVVGGMLVALFCLANRRVQGVGLFGLGLLLNGLVVLANGAMPVSAHALARAGAALPHGGPVRHVLAGDGTALGWLGAIVPVPLPGHREVDSAGDLLIAAGAAQFVFTMLTVGGGDGRPVRRREPARSATGSGRQVRTAAAGENQPRRYRAVSHSDSELVRVIVRPRTDGRSGTNPPEDVPVHSPSGSG